MNMIEISNFWFTATLQFQPNVGWNVEIVSGGSVLCRTERTLAQALHWVAGCPLDNAVVVRGCTTRAARKIIQNTLPVNINFV